MGSYYLRNQWYVAAHGFELADGKPIARTICDQTVVIFRGQDGGVRHTERPLSAPLCAAVLR
jgi:vanillate monooxygenase